MSKKSTRFNGVGGITVPTNSIPTCMKLLNSGLSLPGKMHSHEQPGKHPLLLSEESQARLGFDKNMRSSTIKLLDYDDEIQIYKATGSGLRVICISDFPDMHRMQDWKPTDFVKDLQRSVAREVRKARKTLGMKEDMVPVLPDHETLVANMAKTLVPPKAPIPPERDPGRPDRSVTIMSFGWKTSRSTSGLSVKTWNG